MSIEDAAKAVLSGEYSRRRYHLDRVIVTWDGLALTGTLAIWGFLVRWDALLGPQPDHELFAVLIAWAGALSSILIGLWRLYAHSLYHAIVRLYPTIYFHERMLVSNELCTIQPPEGVKPLAKDTATCAVEYTKVLEKKFGTGGHVWFDVPACIVIVAFGVLSVWIGLSKEVITLWPPGWPHHIGYLLLGNFLGLALVIGSCFLWQNCEHNWPVPPVQDTPGEGTHN